MPSARPGKGEQIDYLDGAYAMRTGFEAVEGVKTIDAIRAVLPYAAAWVVGRDLPVRPGTLGGRQGLERLAEIVSDALDDDLRGQLINFGIRVGARRKADGAHCLHAIGEPVGAAILQEQSRILGSLQYNRHPVRPSGARRRLPETRRTSRRLHGLSVQVPA